MAPVKIPVRDIIIEVSDGAATPVWTEIGGLTSFVVNPGENEEAEDNTTFDSEGAYEQYVMQRGAVIELEGKLLSDPADDTRDPGQEVVEDNAGEDKVGIDSIGQIRFRRPGATQWKRWNCTTSVGEQGGETNNTNSWAATFTRSGKSTLVAVV